MLLQFILLATVVRASIPPPNYVNFSWPATPTFDDKVQHELGTLMTKQFCAP
jgi:hypothetical protein